jgi:ATP-dependent DNA helicase RecG
MNPNSAEIRALIDQGMTSDLHWFPEDVPATRLAATLVGMANTDGGTILLGISPRAGQIQGVRDPEEMIDRIFQAALLADPPLVLPIPRSEIIEGVAILRVTVPPGLPHVYSLEGRYLGRSGKQETPLPARRDPV